MPVPPEDLEDLVFVFRNGQDAHSTRILSFCGTGILPVPQNLAIASSNLALHFVFRNGQDAHSTRIFSFCGTGILSVPQNVAIASSNLALHFAFRNGQDAHSTRILSFCGTGILPVPQNAAGKMPIPPEYLVFVEPASCRFLRMLQSPQAILLFILRFAAPIPKKPNPSKVANQVEGSGTASALFSNEPLMAIASLAHSAKKLAI